MCTFASRSSPPGFLYGWTLFLVIQCGTIAAVAVAFGKFLGVGFPGLILTLDCAHLCNLPISVGPMVLGNMEVGLNTQNLVAIAMIALLSVINIFGVKTGAFVQVVFTTAKVAGLLGLIMFGVWVGRSPEAIAVNFGSHFWINAGWGVLHKIPVGAAGATALVSTLTVIAVAQVGSLFSADAWNNVTFTAGEVRNPQRNLPLSLAVGNRRRHSALYRGEFHLPPGASAVGQSRGGHCPGARNPVRLRLTGDPRRRSR